MTDQITYAYLRNLFENDQTTEEDLAPFFINSPSMHPFSPSLRLNEELVEVPINKRGVVMDFTVGFLNHWSQRRRAAAYQSKMAEGFSGLRFLAEGDSWFQYPILRRDVIDCLDQDFAVYCTSAAGDTLENMTTGVEELATLIAEQKPDGFLFSGGGNDIAGEALVSYLLAGDPGRTTPADYISPVYERFLVGLSGRLTTFFNRLGELKSDMPIFCHGYDWPFPQSGGRWLHPAMEQHGIPQELRAPILKLMIDSYYNVLQHVAAQAKARVILVDCRGIVGTQPHWYDELHPLDDGYARVAAKFREAIEREIGAQPIEAQAGPTRGTNLLAPMPDAASSPMAPTTDVTLTWYPRDDAQGVRRTSKTLPLGATISIGRDAFSEIMLDDDRVSRYHAKLVVQKDGIHVEDLGSTNGTLVAGEPANDTPWQAGALLEIGVFQFEQEQAQLTTPVSDEADAKASKAQKNIERSMIDAAPVEEEEELRYLELELISGNIVNVPSRAYVMGIFDHVKPSGSASEIDEILGNRLSSLVQAHLFGTRHGEISLLPTPQQRSLSEMIVFAGLGSIGSFEPKVLQTVGENLVRVTALARVDELVCVPIGLDSGCTMAQFLAHFLEGMLRGLKSGDPGEEFYSLKICELDDERYKSLEREVKNLLATGYFKQKGFDIKVRRSMASKQSYSDPNSAKNQSEINPVYLEASSAGEGRYKYFLLGAGHGGSIGNTSIAQNPEQREAFRKMLIDPQQFSAQTGAQLANLLLPIELQQTINQKLEANAQSHLVVLHDIGASKIPWEALYFDGKSPALQTGVSRIYKTDLSQKAGGQTSLSRDAQLQMLVVQNPTGDLPGALDEGRSLTQFFRAEKRAGNRA